MIKHYRRIARSCRNTFKSLVATPLSLVVQYANERAIDGAVLFEVDFEDTAQIQIPNTFRTTGKLRITIFAPIGAGEPYQALYQLLDSVFTDKTYDVIYFYAPSIAEKVTEDKWYRMVITVPFKATETVTQQANVSAGTKDVYQASSVLRQRIVAKFPSLQIQRDNMLFTPPSGTLWARWHILFGESKRAASGTVRHIGLVKCSLFDLLEIGDDNILSMADDIAEMFRTLTDTGVVLRTPSVRTLGRSDKWWQVNVTCPFFADEAI